MGMWMETVLPAIHKFLWKEDTKKADAEQACKSFDESKDAISKEFEEKKGELKPKVIEIYEASSKEIKILIKEPNGPDLKKHSTKVQKFLDELVKIDFPGSKAASEAMSKYGPHLGRCPIIFIFENVSTFIVIEKVATKETETLPPPQATSAKAATTDPPTTTTLTREIVLEKAAIKEPEKGKAATTEPLAATTTTTAIKETIVEKVVVDKQPEKGKATTTEPATVATTVAKEIVVDKAVVKEPEKDKAATTQPPVAAATTTTTTVIKEIIVEQVDVDKEPDKGKAAATEPPATVATTMAKEIVVQKVDVKEPEKADAPAKNGKEPPKVEEKKEVPLKP